MLFPSQLLVNSHKNYVTVSTCSNFMVFLKLFLRKTYMLTYQKVQGKKIKIIFHMQKKTLEYFLEMSCAIRHILLLFCWRTVGAFPTLSLGTLLRTLFLASQNCRLFHLQFTIHLPELTSSKNFLKSFLGNYLLLTAV